MAEPQVNLTLSKTEPTFDLSISGVKSVEYVISYQTIVNGQTVTEALEHSGQPNTQFVYKAQHVAGTMSNEDIVYHQVKSGQLELTAITTTGETFKAIYPFTINSLGQLILKEGEVLGETTEASATSLLSEPTLLAAQPPQAEVAQVVSTNQVITTATPTEAGGSGFPLALAGVMGAVILGSIMLAWFLQRRKQLNLQKLN